MILRNIIVFAVGATAILTSSCERIGCWVSSPTSETIHYRGQLAVSGDSIVDTSIDIWFGNLDYVIFGDNGAKERNVPQHPVADGSFLIGGYTSSHSDCETVEQWECGPLRILIEGDNIVTYYDSLTNDELKPLGQNDAGEWVLPPITLQKK